MIAPIKALGGRHWPLNGFIYNEKPGKRGPAAPGRPSKAEPAKVRLTRIETPQPEVGGKAKAARLNQPERTMATKPARRISPESDPIGAIIAGNRR